MIKSLILNFIRWDQIFSLESFHKICVVLKCMNRSSRIPSAQRLPKRWNTHMTIFTRWPEKNRGKIRKIGTDPIFGPDDPASPTKTLKYTYDNIYEVTEVYHVEGPEKIGTDPIFAIFAHITAMTRRTGWPESTIPTATTRRINMMPWEGVSRSATRMAPSADTFMTGITWSPNMTAITTRLHHTSRTSASTVP